VGCDTDSPSPLSLPLYYPICRWFESAGAVLISIYILIVWVMSAMEQIRLLAGHGAEPGFMKVRREDEGGGAFMFTRSFVCWSML
jgi:hypothetical protein